MKGMEKILENAMINSWAQHFKRSPHQINKSHEADAELIEIEGNKSQLLAVTIDSVAEEITEGIYREPFTMGWVTVMSNFSDLAAVGAEPLGIVIAVSVEEERDEKFRGEIAKGMSAACQKLGVFVLGGDTNTTPTTSLTGCAFGFVPRGENITRVGCRVGDVVFMSGGAGTGNAMGLVRLAKLPEELFSEKYYRPIARIKEGQFIRRFATCCMDTSDGLLITLDQLLRINNLGFVVEAGWNKILTPEVFELCNRAKIPHWFMAAGIHGEFELVFTIPPEGVNSFLQAAKEIGFQPIQLGIVQQKPALEFVLSSKKRVKIDMAPLRNLWSTAGSDLSRSIQEHHAWGKKWGLE
ncbi:Thiamine-monophosphate kinase [subsurface metagenome]